MNHRIGRSAFGLAVGLIVAFLSYQWVTDPGKRVEREEEHRVIEASRAIVRSTLAVGDIELVDPLAPQRKVGKVYIYPRDDGWEVSGYYRRDAGDRWHPYLVAMSGDLTLVHLKVQDADPELVRRAASDPRLEATS